MTKKAFILTSSVVLIALVVLISGLMIAHYSFLGQSSQNALRNERESNQMKLYEDVEEPFVKKPPISVSVTGLLRPLVERVWVTTFYDTPSEVYGMALDMPLCSEWLDGERNLHSDVENKDKFLWMHKCSPVEIQAIKTGEDLSGVVIVRMLDFGKSIEILQDVFDIIETDSLGFYRMDRERKDIIKSIIEKKLGSRDRYSPINYRFKLKTYYSLEGHLFLEETASEDPYVTEVPENIRKYFYNRAKTHALSLNYNSEIYKKEGNIVEFALTAPPGFFGF